MYKFILEKKRIKKLQYLPKDGGIHIWIIMSLILFMELISIVPLLFGDFIPIKLKFYEIFLFVYFDLINKLK